jgi:hypothetical protein
MVSQTSTLEGVGRGPQAQVVEQPTNVRLGSKADIAASPIPMSALPPKADIAERRCDVRFVPKADMQLSDPECAITAEMPAPR